MVLALVLIIIAIVVIAFIAIYNSLVVKRKRVQNAWSQIDVQLKRRHDLIPNLVNAVKGYMKFEQETLQKVVEARSKAVGAGNLQDRMKAEGELSGLLSRLLVVMEQYPDLKASQNVAQLTEELTSTENKISYARQFYNDTVMKYNTALEVFPSNIVASMFRFEPYPFFEITSEEERNAPKVDLNF
ncbi:MAG: LemA protein [Thermotogaceae bacterium]|jgi:LemA protein|nr:LemA protein [Thermotogaceae bacterium]